MDKNKTSIENVIYAFDSSVAYIDGRSCCESTKEVLNQPYMYYIQNEFGTNEYVNISNVSNYSSEYVYFLNTDKTFYLYNEISSKALKLALADYNMKKEFLGLIS